MCVSMNMLKIQVPNNFMSEFMMLLSRCKECRKTHSIWRRFFSFHLPFVWIVRYWMLNNQWTLMNSPISTISVQQVDYLWCLMGRRVVNGACIKHTNAVKGHQIERVQQTIEIKYSCAKRKERTEVTERYNAAMIRRNRRTQSHVPQYCKSNRQ